MNDEFNNDSMLELYLFEATTLLEGLDNIMLEAERAHTLETGDINEIFRIMHTIKGSSAMMAFDTISEVAHHMEDIFAAIRENGLRDSNFDGLFDLILKASDFLGGEIAKIQQGSELSAGAPSLIKELGDYEALLRASFPEKEKRPDLGRMLGDMPVAPEGGRILGIEQARAFRQEEGGAKSAGESPTPEIPVPDPNIYDPPASPPGGENTVYLHIYFNEGARMENIRAFMLANKLSELGKVNRTIPDDLEGNAEAADLIVENGFYVSFTSNMFREQIESAAKGTLSVESVSFVRKMPDEDESVQATPAPVSTPKADNALERTDAPTPSPAQLPEHEFDAQPAPAPTTPIAPTSTLSPSAQPAPAPTTPIAPTSTLSPSAQPVSAPTISTHSPSAQPAPATPISEPAPERREASAQTPEYAAPTEPESTIPESTAPEPTAPAPIEPEQTIPTPTEPEPTAPAPTESAPDKQAPAPKTDEPLAPAPERAASTLSAPVKQNIINVDITKLDSLLDLVGEIVINESMVTENSDLSDIDPQQLESFNKAARQLGKLTNELQDSVMSVRMVPVQATFQRMRRGIRDMSKHLGKSVELVILGETTEVDKTILDAIGDPIMHLVRNAMDHAIETPEERAVDGKSPTGHITLSAQNVGGDVIISVSDDGRGLDRDRILAAAQSRGLLKKPESEYTDREIHNLLTAPGFSTRENITEYSGRGVGLDVVRMNIERIGGSVIIESVKGVGTNVLMKIPLTLAIIDCMEIRIGKDIFAIPISNIRESFKPSAGQFIVDPNGNEMMMLRGAVYPVVRLYCKLGIENAVKDLDDGILILTDSTDRKGCLFADELLGKFQVVVKSMPPYLKQFGVKSTGISGCTIMGNGDVSLILDVQELLS